MALQNEIENRERSLAELMTRILQAPLEPIERSVGKIGTDLLESEAQLRTLSATVVAVLEQVTENAKKSDKQGRGLANQFVSDMNDLYVKLVAHVTASLEGERKANDFAMAEHSNRSAASMRDLSEHLASGFSDAKAGHSATQVALTSLNLALNARAQTIHESQIGAIEASLQNILDIRAMQEVNASYIASFTHRFETANNAATARIDATISAQQQFGQQLTDTLAHQHASVSKLLATQHIALQTQITDWQRRFRAQTVLNSVLLLALLSLIGFEVVRRLN